jgi:hypothetical protein
MKKRNPELNWSSHFYSLVRNTDRRRKIERERERANYVERKSARK